MKLSLRERSECFRAFLLLIGQDRVVAIEERELLRHIGKVLDFERRFCEEAIDDLLENAHISTDPPVFSRREYAEAFLCDCIRIARADRSLHPGELAWLVRIAEANGLDRLWLEEMMGTLTEKGTPGKSERMEIEQYI
jgi:hypothetical protein